VRRILQVALLAGAVAVLAATTSRSTTDTAPERDLTFPAPAVGRTLHYAAYLPDDYEASRRRYPVVYFLHGLPAGPTAYRDAGFVARALAQIHRKAIVVAPQAADSDDTDPEYLDRGPNHDWESALTDELVHAVDKRLRTIPRRDGRAIVGLSAGGYGAMLLALHHPELYAAVQSWSGYFHPTDPTGRLPLDLGSSAANTRASVHAQIRARASARLAIAFYVGSSDTRFLQENRLLDRELRAAGIAHVFKVYFGGHSHALWQEHAAHWLRMLFTHLTQAS